MQRPSDRQPRHGWTLRCAIYSLALASFVAWSLWSTSADTHNMLLTTANSLLLAAFLVCFIGFLVRPGTAASATTLTLYLFLAAMGYSWWQVGTLPPIGVLPALFVTLLFVECGQRAKRGVEPSDSDHTSLPERLDSSSSQHADLES